MLLSLTLLPFLLAAQEGATSGGDPLRAAFDNMKAAEQKKDLGLIKKHAVEVFELAGKAAASGQAERAAFAKEVQPHAEYALFTAALSAPDKATTVEVFDILDKHAPASEYLPRLYGAYFAALAQQPGGLARAYQVASKAIEKHPSNTDLLSVLADGAMAQKQWDLAAGYGTRLVAAINAQPRPEGVSEADWEKHRALIAGRGNWIAGISYSVLNRHAEAEKSLKAALPHIKGDNTLLGGALFYLGVANYNLARGTQNKAQMKEALNYSEQASKLGGQYAKLAAQNVSAIRQELAKMR